MKKELPQGVVWAIIGVVLLGAIAFGYSYLAPKPADKDTKAGDTMMNKVKEGGKVYEPPGATVRTGANGQPSGFTPPGQQRSGP